MNANPDIINLLPTKNSYEMPTVISEFDKYNKETLYIPYILYKQDDKYYWIDIILNRYEYNYRSLVDAIIKLKYDLSEAQAILFNYLSDSTNKKYIEEFNNFQAWRKHAKEFAKNHFNLV
jgi:hypothetical protein